jgi:hypothetical protein
MQRKREISPGITETVEFETESDGNMPQVHEPGGNAQSARPSDAVLAKHGLAFDREKGTYVGKDGRPANIERDLWVKLFGRTSANRPLILPAR